MEKNKNHKILLIVMKMITFSIFFLAIVVWVGILAIIQNAIYELPLIFSLIFADIAICCMMLLWWRWIIFEKCDFQAYEKYVLSFLKRKRYKENVNFHKSLLFISLVLRKYDESRQEIDELRRLDSRLTPAQRLEVQLHIIDYMICVNETASLNTELENAKNILQKLSGKNDRIKLIYQGSLKLRQYLIEERWEDVLKLLKIISKNNMTTFEQVNTAYYRGKCCYNLGRYEEAFHEFKFVTKYGGNTMYVTWANDLMEKIPEKNLYESKSPEQSIKVKHRINKITITLAISCLLLILSIGINHYCSHGNSIEEAYSRRYFCAQDELTIIYQKEIDNYELVILYDEGNAQNMAYCLLEETDSVYKIIESFRLDWDLEKNQIHPLRIELTEREKEFYRKNKTNGEIWLVFTDFYQKNSIFYQEDMTYVGICSFPIAENIVVNGNPVNFEEVIYIDETAFCIWSVKNVNLKSSIHVDYLVE